MKFSGTYLKGIDEVSPEDFPALRELLLSRGITPAELRYTPYNLRKHPTFNQFRKYCQYLYDEEFRIKEEKEQEAKLQRYQKHLELIEEQKRLSQEKAAEKMAKKHKKIISRMEKKLEKISTSAKFAKNEKKKNWLIECKKFHEQQLREWI